MFFFNTLGMDTDGRTNWTISRASSSFDLYKGYVDLCIGKSLSYIVSWIRENFIPGVRGDHESPVWIWTPSTTQWESESVISNLCEQNHNIKLMRLKAFVVWGIHRKTTLKESITSKLYYILYFVGRVVTGPHRTFSQVSVIFFFYLEEGFDTKTRCDGYTFFVL